MLRPLLLSLTTALIPFLVKKISLLEQRNDIGEQMKVRVAPISARVSADTRLNRIAWPQITLIRVFSLKMFNIALMLLDLNKVAEADKTFATNLASGGKVRT